MSSDAGRELALLPDKVLIGKLASSGKYAGTAKLLNHSWQEYTGTQISAFRLWIIKALLTKDPGNCPWVDK